MFFIMRNAIFTVKFRQESPRGSMIKIKKKQDTRTNQHGDLNSFADGKTRCVLVVSFSAISCLFISELFCFSVIDQTMRYLSSSSLDLVSMTSFL